MTLTKNCVLFLIVVIKRSTVFQVSLFRGIPISNYSLYHNMSTKQKKNEKVCKKLQHMLQKLLSTISPPTYECMYKYPNASSFCADSSLHSVNVYLYIDGAYRPDTQHLSRRGKNSCELCLSSLSDRCVHDSSTIVRQVRSRQQHNRQTGACTTIAESSDQFFCNAIFVI